MSVQRLPNFDSSVNLKQHAHIPRSDNELKYLKLFTEFPNKAVVFFTHIDLHRLIKDMNIMLHSGHTRGNVVLYEKGRLHDCLKLKEMLGVCGLTNILTFTLNYRDTYSHLVTTPISFIKLNKKI